MKEFLENVFFVTIFDRVLLPNEGIGGDSKKGLKILCTKRAEFEQFALQNGLEIKGHSHSSR